MASRHRLQPFHLFGLFLHLFAVTLASSNVEEVKAFLTYYEEHVSDIYFSQATAQWNYYTNITDENSQKAVDADVAASGFIIDAYVNASRFDAASFSADIQRQLKFIKDVQNYALAVEDEDKFRTLTDIIAKMNGNYGSGEVCKTNGECLALEPGNDDVRKVMRGDRLNHI
ncbi:angiotensin-converting enzyme 2-like [Antedon mediterranea]|uniref:angiotensin-converting enzyme 2-like n=1 Tax=Antedon mediterranea TaxID=105859 RepID=UPI003AF4279A